MDNTVSIFYGYSAALIAQWCSVNEKTAAEWKAGRKKPSRQALKLFRLHAAGRVLGKSWKGWKVHKDAIYSPAGECMQVWEMENHVILYQLADAYRKHILSGKAIDPRYCPPLARSS